MIKATQILGNDSVVYDLFLLDFLFPKYKGGLIQIHLYILIYSNSVKVFKLHLYF